MKTKNMIWAALSMTAALVMTACTNDDNMAETSAAPQDEVKTIPYTVTVGQGGDAATTRATVESDMKTLKFAAGDKLYVTGTNISGTLDIQTGTGTASATFSGDLTYTGDGSPASDLSLAAILVGTNNKGVKITDGVINLFCPNDAYCADVNEAVEEYSALFGTSTYSEKSFTLTQMNAFLNFEITFVDGTTTGTTLSTVVSNNGSAIATANVTTTTESEKVVAKFVLPVPSDVITLSGATVKMGDKEAISFGASQTLEGKVYNVKRTYAPPTLAQTMTTAGMTVKVKYNYNGEENYCLFVSNGDNTYTFLSGYGWAGRDDGCAKALVVEGGKLVFKQNLYDTIDNQWSNYGFSATFDTSNNSYKQFVGPWAAEGSFNPSFISVEVNSVPIALTKIITVADLVKENDQSWSDIIVNNSDKIKEDDDYGSYVVRISDGAKLQRNMYGDEWQDVTTHDSYQEMDTYKFEGD